MNLFYLKHHYLSIVRSRSFGGEVIAFIILIVLAKQSIPAIHSSVDSFVERVSSFFGSGEANFKLFLLVYFSSDLAIKLFFKRPSPKMKYYLLWTNNVSSISGQYMITSLFGIVPFFMVACFLPIYSKTFEWLGSEYLLIIVGLWVSNFYTGLLFQYSTRKIQLAGILLLAAIASIVLFNIIPVVHFVDLLFTPTVVLILLALSVAGSFYSVRNYLKKRIVGQKKKFQFSIGRSWINFRNPLFQLEWALIARNKRTRSNLLMGMLSILILPFLLEKESPEILMLLIMMFCTSFFIIQHGVYSLGWEGTYFDFLVTNVSIREFLKSRYIFYVGTSIVGFVLFLIPTIVNKLDIGMLVSMLLYNVGITIPLVLYRSAFNSTKIELSENSFMNYNGMLTGPIMVTSLLVTLLPFIFYGLSQPFLADHAVYGLGAIGLIGLVLNSFFIRRISSFLSRKKYHLSQSFKS
ncbi:MAG: DUF5687 family protein [Cyclobacteriaceae bacterium]